jgi:hypothetical protein
MKPNRRRRTGLVIFLAVLAGVSALVAILWPPGHGKQVDRAKAIPHPIQQNDAGNAPVAGHSGAGGGGRKNYAAAINGVNEMGFTVGFPPSLTYELDISADSEAVRHLSKVLAEEGMKSRARVSRMESFPRDLESVPDSIFAFGPVFLIRADAENAESFEQRLQRELKPLLNTEKYDEFWERFRQAAHYDPNLRGFGRYDLYIRFREEDPSNPIVAAKYALCRPGTLEEVSIRDVQSTNFGPFLGAIFSYNDDSLK